MFTVTPPSATRPPAARRPWSWVRHPARFAMSAAVLAACGASAFAPSAARGQAEPGGSDVRPAPEEPGLSARETEPLSEQPVYPEAPARVEARTPLMEGLDRLGVGRYFDDARIRLYGHVEVGVTHNFADPPTDPRLYNPLPGRGFAIPNRVDNPGRVFDVEHDDPLLNQLTLNIDRPVDISPTGWDVGGRIEMMYGADARFIHANGVFDNYLDEPSRDTVGGPENQFDIVQMFADVNIPVGNGLRIRGGKFTYFKPVDPNNSVFYSHSFTFGGALPFTLTGVYATYPITENLTVDLGINRGWDQAIEDNNEAISVHGRVSYAFSRDTVLAAQFITGPEQDDDEGNFRTAVDVTLRHNLTDRLTLLFDAVYGQQAQAEFLTVDPDFGTADLEARGTAEWYGISGYAIYRINDNISAAARLEWYRDDGGYTTAVDQTLYEATVGLTITPFPNDRYGQNLKIRPEIRWDYSTEPFFDGFSKHDQLTIAVDAIFNF